MEHFQLTERLHTDVLEEKYGQIHVEVLEHSQSIRRAHLVDEQGVSRTYAVTLFPESWDNPEIAEINEKIANGQAIGKTFREYGYSIRKNVIDVYISEIPNWLRSRFKTDESQAKVRLSEFYAKKAGLAPIVYGVVAEIYSPDFRPAVINLYDESQISATTATLAKHNINIQEVWRRIGLDNDYHDLETELELAKEETKPILNEIKERIKKSILQS